MLVDVLVPVLPVAGVDASWRLVVWLGLLLSGVVSAKSVLVHGRVSFLVLQFVPCFGVRWLLCRAIPVFGS